MGGKGGGEAVEGTERSPSVPARGWLRAEGLSVVVLAIVLYVVGGHSWRLFAILFLAPDLGFLGYLGGPRLGALIYNCLHTYVAPLTLAAGLVLAGSSPAIPLIWLAHIGFDRVLGFGLKLPSGFQDTHLGPIGRAGQRAGDRRGSPAG